MTHKAARILLADDHALFLRATTDILCDAGYQCDGVADAAAAVAALERQEYDLLIADIRMPGNDNLELLHTCARAEHALPLILVTACPSIDTAVESLRAAVVDYLIKPLEVPQLLSSVERALAQGRLWKSMRQTRQDMQAWTQNLEHLEQSMLSPGGQHTMSGMIWSLEQYLEQTTRTLVQTVASLHQTLTTIRQGPSLGSIDVCTALQCPRRARYEASIEDAITVINQTKNAFKSRDLGELRKRLEAVRGTATSAPASAATD